MIYVQFILKAKSVLTQWLEYRVSATHYISSNLIHVYITKRKIIRFLLYNIDIFILVIFLIRGTCCKRFYILIADQKKEGSIPTCLFYILTSLMVEQDIPNIKVQVQFLSKNF